MKPSYHITDTYGYKLFKISNTKGRRMGYRGGKKDPCQRRAFVQKTERGCSQAWYREYQCY
jgi:hypothetical protein